MSYIKIEEIVKEFGVIGPVNSISDFISEIRSISGAWQKEDWERIEKDEDNLLNDARLVGQVWFRGHADVSMSLSPGLYREGTRINLTKGLGSPQPTASPDEQLLGELFTLEHELRIDFRSYGHLLNEANQAKTDLDWYFMMQHHGVPTRLLDWTTNALAALFFAIDGLRQRIEDRAKLCPNGITESEISVWMIDAYDLASTLSDTWGSPILSWSDDAERYLPTLEALIKDGSDAYALLPKIPMPIEPPAMHPRVAAQEGRFVIFGREQDLLQLNVKQGDDEPKAENLRIKQILFAVGDVDSVLRDLAQLGVSRRTLFPDLAGLADFVRWKHLHKVRGYKISNSNIESDSGE